MHHDTCWHWLLLFLYTLAWYTSNLKVHILRERLTLYPTNSPYTALPYGSSTTPWWLFKQTLCRVNVTHLGCCWWVCRLRPTRGPPPLPESRWVCAPPRALRSRFSRLCTCLSPGHARRSVTTHKSATVYSLRDTSCWNFQNKNISLLSNFCEF